MLERIKEALQSTDEEWKVIGPLITDVMEKQREARGFEFRGRGFAGAGGPRGRGGFGPPGQEVPEVTALQQALDSETTSPAEIKAKLDAYRQARAAREKDLSQAREKLRQVLTVRQEATLVLMGLLD